MSLYGTLNMLLTFELVIDSSFSPQITESWSYPPLNDTAEAASKVLQALAERGWRLRP